MLDSIFPTLFEKTFFIVGCQLMITSLATYLTFQIFKKVDPDIETDGLSNLKTMHHLNPQYRWILTPTFITCLLVADMITFLVLLFWAADQSLLISFPIFSLWSIMTGIEIEFILIDYEHGLGRRVAALTGVIVFFAFLVGVYSHIDFGFLKIPLFISLCVLLALSLTQILIGMSTLAQRLISLVGVVIFSIYLVYDFFRLEESEKLNPQSGWADAMHISIKIYLDIINLFLKLLQLLGRHHH